MLNNLYFLKVFNKNIQYNFIFKEFSFNGFSKRLIFVEFRFKTHRIYFVCFLIVTILSKS